jgi:hypothetical protein
MPPLAVTKALDQRVGMMTDCSLTEGAIEFRVCNFRVSSMEHSIDNLLTGYCTLAVSGTSRSDGLSLLYFVLLETEFD